MNLISLSRPLSVFSAVTALAVSWKAHAQDFTVVNLPTQNVDAPLSYYGTFTHLTPATSPSSYSGFSQALSAFAEMGGRPQQLGTFDIVINPGVTLAANAAALAAFNRAAQSWEALIADPITITINADLAALGPGILGSASSVILAGGYNTIRNQVVTDALDEGADDALVTFLPTAALFTATLPTGGTLSGNLLGTKANLKAAGFAGLDGIFGVSDANITFSTGFSFDFDNSNGITPGQFDFEGVAAHEIGHALGFFSSVDEVDAGTITGISPNILDLFRFNLATNNPSNTTDFTTMPREMRAGQEAVSDFLTDGEYRMSTGQNLGDGRQASHWKDSLGIGLMDPTLAAGELGLLTYADFRAMDLIGYEIIPEPTVGVTALLGTLALGLIRHRR